MGAVDALELVVIQLWMYCVLNIASVAITAKAFHIYNFS